MISPRLLDLVRCPDCHGRLMGTAGGLQCAGCGRSFAQQARDFLVLQPRDSHRETTRFVEDSFHADGRDESVAPPLLSAAVRHTMLHEFLEPRRGETVLDLGCGSGRFSVWMLDSGAQPIGIDTGTFFAAEARRDIDLVVGDLRHLPFGDASISKAYAIDVLEHLSEDGVDSMLREVARVLTPGGSLFVYTHVMQLSPLAPILKGITRVAHAIERAGLSDLTIERLRPTDHLNPLRDRRHLDEVALRSGFRVSRFRYYTPLLSRIAEIILIPVAAQAMARRHRQPGPAAEARRAARLEAKQRLGRRGVMYRVLRGLTSIVMLDVRVLGRVRSGPFFALLVKQG